MLSFVLAAASLASAPGIEEQVNFDGRKIYLSIDDAVRLALEHNSEVRLEALKPEAGREQWRAERGIFDPYVEFDMSSNYQKRVSFSIFQPPGETERNEYRFNVSQLFSPGTRLNVALTHNRSSDTSSSATFNPYYYSTLNATVTQPLLKGFGSKATKHSITAARARSAVSSLEFEILFTRTIRDVVAAYWDVLHALENLRVAREALDRAKDLRAEIEARVQVGLLPPVERAQADAGVASREETIVVAENTLAAAKDRLRLLIGLPMGSPLWDADLSLAEKSIETTDLPVLEEAVKTALAQRPEMRRMTRQEEIGDADLAFARSQRRPRLDFFATQGFTGLSGVSTPLLLPDVVNESWSDSFSQISSGDFPNWAVGINFAYPIGNRAADGAYRAARLAREQISLSRENLEKSILVEVRAAIRNVDSNLKRVEAARANRVLQEKNVAVETERHRNGLSTVYQVLQTQADLTTAQTAELRARLDYQLSLVDLDKALGTLAGRFGYRVAE